MARVRKTAEVRDRFIPANDNQKRVAPKSEPKIAPAPEKKPEATTPQPAPYLQWKEKRMHRHSERAARAIDRKTSVHYEECSSIAASHDRRIMKKHNELKDYYQLRQKQRQINHLKRRLEKPGFLEKITLRLFGGERKITQQIETLKANRENAQRRFDEQMDTLKKKREQALAQLKVRQQEELKRLNQKLKQMEPTERTLSQEWAKVAHRQQHQRRNQRRDGPSISR